MTGFLLVLLYMFIGYLTLIVAMSRNVTLRVGDLDGGAGVLVLLVFAFWPTFVAMEFLRILAFVLISLARAPARLLAGIMVWKVSVSDPDQKKGEDPS